MMANLNQAAKGNPQLLPPADVASIPAAIMRQRAPDPTTTGRLLAAAGGENCPAKLPPLGQRQCADLLTLARAFSQFVDVEAQIPDPAAQRAARDKIQLVLRDAYRVVGKANVTAFAYEDVSATSDKLRIGTLFSFGVAALNAGRTGARGASFSAVSLKFYYRAVDKSLPDPYYGSACGRCSFALGLLSSNSSLEYRGQTQAKLAGDFTPTVSFAFDATRYLTAQIGLVAFQQPNTNPATTSNKSFRLAWFLGFGVDFDAANQLKNLLSNR
jgi:hypothetical protein